MPLQIRRGTEAERQAMTVPLAVGEPLFVTDTGSIYVGNGTSPGGVQVTGLTIEDSVDAVAAALVAGVNQNVTFVYGTAQDQANRIDCRLDLSTVEGTIDADGFKGPLLADDSGVIVNSANRNITANEISATQISATDISAGNLTISGTVISSAVISDFKGSVFGDDSSILVDALDSSINLSGTIKANVVPAFNDVIELGSVGTRFRSLYLSNAGLFINDARIQSTFFGAIELPEGSTVGGQPISVIGNLTGDINANIIGDDSGVIVNVATRDIIASSITGQLITGDLEGNVIGDLTGSVFGDDSSIIIDATGDARAVIGEIKFDLLLGRETSLSNPNSSSISLFDGVQERICFNSETLGTIGDAAAFLFRCHKGNNDNRIETVAGDFLGGMFISGYRPGDVGTGSGGYRTSMGVIGGWDAGADFTEDYPGSSITILTGSNNSVSPTFFTFGGDGVFEAPVIKPASYATVDLPLSPAAGWIVFDSTSNQFKGYNGTAWVVLG